jgi:DNA polymerase-1
MNSSEQLCILLYDVLKLKPFKWGNPSKKDGKTRPSADSEVLEKFADAHPAITKLMENRDTQKLHSTYVLGMMKRMDANYRIHTDFNQHITVTGRLSSSNPNLQNIPRANKDIKKAFITDPGYSLIQFDFSQAEFRFWAVYSNDPKMMEDIKNGVDIHKVTASEFYGVPEKDVTKEMRNAAKTIVFGLMYGRGAAAVSKQVGLSEDDAKKIINNFFAKYPVAARWLKQIQMFAKQHGYVPTEFGRVRRLPAVYSGNKEEEAEAMRQATNSPIQGGVADLTGIGLIKIHRRLRERGLRARMLLTVHDSIVVRSPQFLPASTSAPNGTTIPGKGSVIAL